MDSSRYKTQISKFIPWSTEQILVHDVQCLLTGWLIEMVGLTSSIHLLFFPRTEKSVWSYIQSIY